MSYPTFDPHKRSRDYGPRSWTIPIMPPRLVETMNRATRAPPPGAPIREEWFNFMKGSLRVLNQSMGQHDDMSRLPDDAFDRVRAVIEAYRVDLETSDNDSDYGEVAPTAQALSLHYDPWMEGSHGWSITLKAIALQFAFNGDSVLYHNQGYPHQGPRIVLLQIYLDIFHATDYSDPRVNLENVLHRAGQHTSTDDGVLQIFDRGMDESQFDIILGEDHRPLFGPGWETLPEIVAFANQDGQFGTIDESDYFVMQI